MSEELQRLRLRNEELERANTTLKKQLDRPPSREYKALRFLEAEGAQQVDALMRARDVVATLCHEYNILADRHKDHKDTPSIRFSLEDFNICSRVGAFGASQASKRSRSASPMPH